MKQNDPKKAVHSKVIAKHPSCAEAFAFSYPKQSEQLMNNRHFAYLGDAVFLPDAFSFLIGVTIDVSLSDELYSVLFFLLAASFTGVCFDLEESLDAGVLAAFGVPDGLLGVLPTFSPVDLRFEALGTEYKQIEIIIKRYFTLWN